MDNTKRGSTESEAGDKGLGQNAIYHQYVYDIEHVSTLPLSNTKGAVHPMPKFLCLHCQISKRTIILCEKL